MRITISIPDDLHSEMLRFTAQQQLETGKSVKVSTFIRDAIADKLNSKKTHKKAVSKKASKQTSGKRTRVSEEEYAIFCDMQKAGKTGAEIAEKMCRSVPTISRLRKRLKDEKEKGG